MFFVAHLVVGLLSLPCDSNVIRGQESHPSATDNAVGWQADLKLALSTLEQEYAYQANLNLDWKMIGNSYWGRLENVRNRRDFFSLIEQLAEEPHDHHLHLNQNSQDSYRLVPSSLNVWVEFEQGVYRIKSIRDFSRSATLGSLVGGVIEKIDGQAFDVAVRNRLAPFADKNSDQAKSWAARTLIAGRQSQESIVLTVSDQQGKPTDYNLQLGGSTRSAGLLSRRQLEGGIEYVRIENSLGQTELVSEFDRLVDDLDEQPSMILDLRNTPSGGNTFVARGIMGRLISEENPYQRHELIEQPFGVPRIWVERVAPRGRSQFTGQLVVLVGRWTGSMGEGMAIGLDGMGRATTIGTPMAGLLGATRRIDLPHSGFGIYLPVERLFHVDGTPRENYRPNIEIKPQPAAADGDPVVKQAVLELQKNK